MAVHLGMTSADLELQAIHELVLQDRNEQLGEDVLVSRFRIQIAGGIDTDHLVVELGRRLQNVGVELSRVAPRLVTDGAAHLACGQLEQTALEVHLEDVLLILRAGLQARGHTVDAILACRRVAVEDRVIEAAGAVHRHRAEAGVCARQVVCQIALQVGTPAIVGSQDHAAPARERVVTRRDVVGGGLTSRVVQLARPVLERQIELEPRLDLPRGADVVGLAATEAVERIGLEHPIARRIGPAVEQDGELERHRMLCSGSTRRDEVRVSERSRISQHLGHHFRIGVVQGGIDRAVRGGVVGHRDFPAEARVRAGEERTRFALREAGAREELDRIGDVVRARGHEGVASLW